jgi:hypothetical protein
MFKLVIECSKDIDNLSINFSDGTSVVTESKPKETKEIKEPKVKEIKEIKKPERKHLDTYLDTEEDYSYQQEIVHKPVIENIQRPAKVSEELQNLDL